MGITFIDLGQRWLNCREKVCAQFFATDERLPMMCLRTKFADTTKKTNPRHATYALSPKTAVVIFKIAVNFV